MLGSVDLLQAVGDGPGGSGVKARVEHSWLARVEVVADQGDAWRLRKCTSIKIFQDLGKIQVGAPSGHLHMPPALEGRRDHEQIGRARADVRVIQAGGPVWLRRPGCTYFLMQNLGDLVHADNQVVGVQGSLIGAHDRFLIADIFAVGIGFQAPAAHFPKLQPVFLSHRAPSSPG